MQCLFPVLGLFKKLAVVYYQVYSETTPTQATQTKEGTNFEISQSQVEI